MLDVLREPLLRARQGSRWAEDELAGGALPPGEWWVVDPAEGTINHVHAMDDWAVTATATATLVHDNRPVLTVVHLPLTGNTYTAVAGGGARLNDRPVGVSAKTDLGAALVGRKRAMTHRDAVAPGISEPVGRVRSSRALRRIPSVRSSRRVRERAGGNPRQSVSGAVRCPDHRLIRTTTTGCVPGRPPAFRRGASKPPYASPSRHTR
ncbi:inositol monophosphatase family protein [Streptomyces sp. NPDC058613]|uniref:inositol monophosphatase family protein n=1 Tax=unclassified Streptomyces TaxID=2593676 RepID=UPI003656DB83